MVGIVATSASPDPFDPSELAKLRLSQNFAELAAVETVITTVTVRKPNNQEFVRVRPGEENRFPTACFVDKTTGDVYLVSPSLFSLMNRHINPIMLVVFQIRDSSTPYLWPLKLPGTDGRSNSWHESAIEAAKLAETCWIQVQSDQSTGRYQVQRLKVDIADPDWTKTPSIGELMKLAFRDRFLGSVDHPIVKRLTGDA